MTRINEPPNPYDLYDGEDEDIPFLSDRAYEDGYADFMYDEMVEEAILESLREIRER